MHACARVRGAGTRARFVETAAPRSGGAAHDRTRSITPRDLHEYWRGRRHAWVFVCTRMSLISAVTPTEAPQAGVKRSITGRPTGLGTNLPAFRGKPITADGPVKAPKLSQGNRNNEGTNVAIPYNRVCPLEFLSGWTGRLSPGDVAFIMKYPPGFLSKQVLGNNGTNGTATMSRVIGLDGVNRLLHGSGNPDGWVAGDNVFVDKKIYSRSSPLKVLQVDANGRMGGFQPRCSTRFAWTAWSSPTTSRYSFTSNGSRDAVIFNNVIQGPRW